MKLLLKLWPNLEPDDITSRSMGAGGEDILLSPAARKVYPFSIECKSLSNVAVYKHLEQAQENTPKGAVPLVVMKANRKKPIVIVDLEWFVQEWATYQKLKRK